MDDPIGEPLTLAALWADLARIAGEPVPTDVAALLDSPRPIRPILPVLKPPCRVCIVESCEACSGPAEADGYREHKACITLCVECAEEDQEYARGVATLRA